MVLIFLISFFSEISMNSSPLFIIFDYVISLIGYIALYGYSYKKQFFRPVFWKIYFILFLIWEIVIVATTITHNSFNLEYMSQMFIVIIILPMFMALYKYAFKFEFIQKCN